MSVRITYSILLGIYLSLSLPASAGSGLCDSTTQITLEALADSSCSQDTVTLLATDIPGAMYDWFPKETLLPSSSYSTLAFPDSTTQYGVTITDSLCPSVAVTVYANVIAGPEFQIEISSDDTLCKIDWWIEPMCVVADSTYSEYDYFWLCYPLTWPQERCIFPWVDSTYTYYIRVTAPSGCRKYDTTTVSTYSTPEVGWINQPSICKGDSTQLTPNVYSTTDDRYLWEPASGLSDPAVLAPIAFPDSTITYKFTAFNSLVPKCSTSTTTTVHVGNNFNPWISADTSICYGDSVELCAGGDNNFSYNIFWTPILGLSTGHDTCTMASPIQTTTYTAQIGSAGCRKYETVKVEVHDDFETWISADTAICFGETVELCAGGDSNVVCSFLWKPSIGHTGFGPCILAYPYQTTTYTVELGSHVCKKLEEVTVVVSNPQFEAESACSLCVGDSIQLNCTYLPGYSYHWYGENVLEPSARNPMVLPADNLSYTVEAIDSLSPYCTVTANIQIPTKGIRPKVKAEAINYSIQKGQSTTLIAILDGALIDTSYSWYPIDIGRFARTPTVSPTETTRYFVTVSDHGCTDTASVVITVGKSTVIQKDAIAHTFSIHPNPTTGKLHVEARRSTHLILLDLLGTELKRWEMEGGDLELDLSSLRTGVYFLNISSEGTRTVIRKIVKQ